MVTDTNGGIGDIVPQEVHTATVANEVFVCIAY